MPGHPARVEMRVVAALDSNVSTPASADRRRSANRMTRHELDQLISGLLFVALFFLALGLIISSL
jgi:hypothetical protein